MNDDQQHEAQAGEQQEQEEQEEEVEYEVEEPHRLPGPTESVSMVYPERGMPSGDPVDSLAVALAYEEQLAGGEEEQRIKKKREAASNVSRRVVREFAVKVGQDGAPVPIETPAMRFMSFELESRFTLDRSGFLLQGPPQSERVPGHFSKPAPMNRFPREEVIIGSLSQLAIIDGLPSRNKVVTWSKDQAAQARGAVARLDGRVLLGSGVLLSKNTVVAFPGVCVRETYPIDIDELDLSPASFTDIKCAKNAAVLYNEPLPSDYGNLKMQVHKIDQYAVEGYMPGKDDSVGGVALEPIIPRFALVHRVIGTVGEIIARLQVELAQLEPTSEMPDEFTLPIKGARERIAELEMYDASTKIDFYAYQVLDEKQSIAAYTEKLSTFGKLESTAAQLQHCVKTIIERRNTITYTLDWAYHTASEPDAQAAFAKIALPIVPHAVYAQLQLDYVPVAAPAKKGTKRSGAGVPISATPTENQVLAKQLQPPPKTPTRAIRSMEPGIIPGLSVQLLRPSVITKQPAPTPWPPSKAPQPTAVPAPSTTISTTTTTTTTGAVFRKVTAPSATTSTTAVLRKVAAPGDAPKTPPTKAPTAKAPANEEAEQPGATAPDAKKPRTQQTPIKPEPPTSSAVVVVPQRTPEQQAMTDRLREMLPKLLARPDAERFGIWGDIATTDTEQYTYYPHPEPPANMKDALFDYATALVYSGMAETVLRALNQEAAARAAPTTWRRPKI